MVINYFQKDGVGKKMMPALILALKKFPDQLKLWQLHLCKKKKKVEKKIQ